MMSETLTSLVEKSAPAADIGTHLDGLPSHERVKEVLALPAKLQ